MTTSQQPGWYPDPWGQGGQRWWDGREWTGQVAGAGGAQPQPTPQPQPVPVSEPVPAWAAQAPGLEPPVPTVPAGPWQGPWQAPATVPGAGAALRAQGAWWLLPGGSVAVLLGSLLPWADVTVPFLGTVTVNGMEADGKITLVAALVLGLLAYRAIRSTRARGLVIGALVVALLVAAVAVIDMVDIARFAEAEGAGFVADTSIGIGLWLVLLGAVAVGAGCVHALATHGRAAR